MGRYKIGDRVGAISHATEDMLYLFGYGVYQGDAIPDPALKVCLFGILMEHANPCIMLDSGDQVFGCECWWGPEDQIKQKEARATHVEYVNIVEERKKAQEA